jgi:pimeloyl-ACP methyl ester carboxylesterase
MQAIYKRGKQPTLILLHGIEGDRYQMKLFWDTSYAVLAPDLPGHGESQNAPYRAFASTEAQLQELISTHNIKRYVFVGYSLGGFLACYLVSKGFTPEKIVLIASGIAYPKLSASQQLLQKLLPFMQRTSITKMIDAYRLEKGQAVAEQHDVDYQTLRAFSEDLENSNFTADMTQLKIPILIIHGQKDKIVPVTFGRSAKQALPNAQYVETTDDHNTIVTNPLVRAQLVRFMQQQ